MNTATAHRLLTALAHEGLLNFDPYAKTYHVGFELLQIAESAQAVAPDLKLRHHLRPMLASIAWRTEESTYLSILANRDSVCIDLAEGTYPISANTPSGRRTQTSGRRCGRHGAAGGFVFEGRSPDGDKEPGTL